MIDTHAHLLPGIDDGATSLEESIRLVEDAIATGFEEVVCTPHLSHSGREVASIAPQRLPAVARALQDAGLHLRLHLGYEMTFSLAASLDIEELRAYSLGGGGWAVLVEMPYQGWPPKAEEAVFRWRVQGLLPILAHPERNPRVQGDPRLLERLLELGAVAQGTAPSLLGFFGPEAKRCLLRLLSRGMVSLLATDAHGRRAGYEHFGQALTRLQRLAPDLDIGALTSENPRRVLSGESPLPLEPVSVAGARRFVPWWSRGRE